MTSEDIRVEISGLSGLNENNIALLDFALGEYFSNNQIIFRSYMILKGNHQFNRDEDRSERTILYFDIPDTAEPTHDYDHNCIVVNGSSNEPIVNVGIEDIYIERIDS